MHVNDKTRVDLKSGITENPKAFPFHVSDLLAHVPGAGV
jgi:hypothetical protein